MRYSIVCGAVCIFLLTACTNTANPVNPTSTSSSTDTPQFTEVIFTPTGTQTPTITPVPWLHNRVVGPLEEGFLFVDTFMGIFAYRMGCPDADSSCMENLGLISIPDSAYRSFDISPNGQFLAVDVLTNSTGGVGISHIMALDMNNNRYWQIAPDGSYQPKWSPDSTHLAYIDYYNNNICLATIDGQTRCEEHKVEIAYAPPAWSPNGTQLAYSVGNNIYVSDISGPRPVRIASGCTEPSWSPDGMYLACRKESSPWNLQVFDVHNCVQKEEPCLYASIYTKTIYTPQWSPDGKYLAFFSFREQNQKRLSVIDAQCLNDSDACEKTVRILSGTLLTVKEYVWSPDGQVLAFYLDSLDNHLFLMRADGTGMDKVDFSKNYIRGLDWEAHYYPHAM